MLNIVSKNCDEANLILLHVETLHKVYKIKTFFIKIRMNNRCYV